MTKKIILNCVNTNSRYYKKYVALVDEVDFKRANKFKWTVLVMKCTQYAQSTINGKHIYLHRFIVNPPPNQFIDHIDGDGLNCVSSNLRICSHSENAQNRRIQKNKKVSKFKGVDYSPEIRRNKKWRATIIKDYKRYSLGYHLTQEDAALRYNEEAKKLFGEFAKLNII